MQINHSVGQWIFILNHDYFSLPLLVPFQLKVRNVLSKYRLDTEAKGSTGFRILKMHIKSRRQNPESFMTHLKNSKTVDPIG